MTKEQTEQEYPGLFNTINTLIFVDNPIEKDYLDIIQQVKMIHKGKSKNVTHILSNNKTLIIEPRKGGLLFFIYDDLIMCTYEFPNN
jgi:hypothetical protein